jgi:hypothetical protein
MLEFGLHISRPGLKKNHPRKSVLHSKNHISDACQPQLLCTHKSGAFDFKTIGVVVGLFNLIFPEGPQ